jgi:hypothetical protein
MRWKAITEVLSQKNVNWNGVSKPIFFRKIAPHKTNFKIMQWPLDFFQ